MILRSICCKELAEDLTSNFLQTRHTFILTCLTSKFGRADVSESNLPTQDFATGSNKAAERTANIVIPILSYISIKVRLFDL